MSSSVCSADFYAHLAKGNLIQTDAQRANRREISAYVCPGLIAFLEASRFAQRDEKGGYSGRPTSTAELRFEVEHRISFEDTRDQLIAQFGYVRTAAVELAREIVRSRESMASPKSSWPSIVRHLLMRRAGEMTKRRKDQLMREGKPIVLGAPVADNAPDSGFRLYC